MLHVLITGGSRGIGAAVADRMVRDGWRAISMSRSNGFDVTAPDFASALGPHMTSRLGAIVCCAGDVEPTPLADETADRWQHSLAVNLTHQWTVLRAVAASSMSHTVVLVGSTAGTRPSPGWSSYAAAKAALHNLAVTAAEELAPRGHRIYLVVPGRCATDLRAKLAPDEDPAAIMQPDEVAEVIATCIHDTGGVLCGAPIEVKRRR